MKAIVYTQYGPPEVLQLKEIEKPVPKDNEILIKIHASAVNSGDWRVRKAEPFAVRLFFGLTKPKKNILGGVLSGVVESTGKNVTKFKTGDEVFGSTGMNLGTYAEYKCLPENAALAIKPAGITHEEAATIPFGGYTALYFLRKANIKPGQKVLIYGASGAVGSAAIQIAKHFGAEVTAVCSTNNIEMVKSLGADKVIDYTKENLARSDKLFDVVYETVGKLPFYTCKKLLYKKGKLLLGGAGLGDTVKGAWTSMTSNRKVITGVAMGRPEEILYLKDLVEKGKLRPFIDKTYTLEQIQEAHRHAEGGHKRGNIAITIASV
jgi:NADPH:quinone reductase-like Zn-dependent oxidoreductase